VKQTMMVAVDLTARRLRRNDRPRPSSGRLSKQQKSAPKEYGVSCKENIGFSL
jgi:hypothetical protein